MKRAVTTTTNISTYQKHVICVKDQKNTINLCTPAFLSNQSALRFLLRKTARCFINCWALTGLPIPLNGGLFVSASFASSAACVVSQRSLSRSKSLSTDCPVKLFSPELWPYRSETCASRKVNNNRMVSTRIQSYFMIFNSLFI